jgi:alpha-1,6-mannosyltransferase
LVAAAVRGVSACGLLVLAFTVPILAARAGHAPAPAMWAVLANPLFLIDGIAGGHNDLLMTALVSAALVAATSTREWLPAMAVAGAFIGVAATVKLPALIALPFLMMVWTRQRGATPTWRAQLSGTAVAASVCLTVCAVVSVASGYGFGWLQTGTSAHHSGGPAVAAVIVVATAVAWERSRVWDPVAMLTVAVVAMLMLVPVGEWWYWMLPIAVAAPVLTRRLTATVLAATSLTLLLVVRPDGYALHLRLETLMAAGLFAAWLLIDRSRPSSWRANLTSPRRQ